MITWSNTNHDEQSSALQIISSSSPDDHLNNRSKDDENPTKIDQVKSNIICPSCGHSVKLQDQAGIQDLPGLPAGVKFDPSDQEILQHLEAKVNSDTRKLHPLIDEFIPTIDGENGICYTHPEKLPGVNKEGQVRHFFHRPSKAYTTGTRKRRKVHNDADGGETRWHKTGKTRPISNTSSGSNIIKGYKKILVLYTNYGRQRKPEKTNWVMHQYHLGNNEEEKDGELVLSKVFYQTQPRQCGSSSMKDLINKIPKTRPSSNEFVKNASGFVEYYNASSSPFMSYNNSNVGSNENMVVINRDTTPATLMPNLVVHGADGLSYLHLPSNASKGK